MRILALGDVVSQGGCNAVTRVLPQLKQRLRPDLCIINGENSAVGNGMTESSVEQLYSCGAHVITGGNHSLRRKELFDPLERDDCLLRPYNMSVNSPGKGVCVIDLGFCRAAVINLLGMVNVVGAFESPFTAVDRALREIGGVKVVVVDFHAEATSEKAAMAHYLCGRASVVFGTHTHVQTADERIIGSKTGFISDLGMCGSSGGVLGIKPGIIVDRFTGANFSRFEACDQAPYIVCGCLFEVSEKSGVCTKVQRISVSLESD